MIALDAVTGTPGFASCSISSRVSSAIWPMLEYLQSPTVYKNIVITGSANGEGAPTAGAYGDIRAWDAYSGKLVDIPYGAAARRARQ